MATNTQSDQILNALKAGPMFPLEIAKVTNIDVTNVHPLLSVLHTRGKVTREKLPNGKRRAFRYARADAPAT